MSFLRTILFSLSLCAATHAQLKIGDAAFDFSLPGIDGKNHGLADYKDAKILCIAFMSNHCPDSQAAEGRIKKLVDDFREKGVQLVAVNPNHPDGLRPDELGYSKYNDGFEDMQKHAAEQKFNFPYLYDGETQAMSHAYGCLATPHFFIFDAGRKLQYHGRLDESRYADESTVKSPDARRAIEAMLADQPVPVAETKPHGCSTKWRTKKSAVAEDDEKWAKAMVDMETIDIPAIEALRKNGTRKYRLINVWATWCGPCVAEFPELVKTSRKFGLRDFELITISFDQPADKDKAKAFLEKMHVATTDSLKKSIKEEGRNTNHYLFTGPDQDAMMKALDPEAPGPIPHSILVSPKGEILWRHNGTVDGEELRGKVLEAMGRFYKPE